MLSIENAQRLGFEECINILGRDFVKKNKDTACSWYSVDQSVIRYGVGVTDEEPPKGKFRLTEIPYKYRATVLVDCTNGEIQRAECIVPDVNGLL